MKKTALALSFSLFLFSSSAFADWGDIAIILPYIIHITEFVEGIKNLMTNLTSITDKMREELKGELKNDLTGNYGMGTYNQSEGEKYQTWNGGNKWQNVMDSYQGSGDLGSIAKTLHDEYPIQSDKVEKASINKKQAQYYTLQAKTALAARASSQYVFDKIDKQVEYQRDLQKQIEKTSDLKAAVDLQNRLQVENNFLLLQMLRLLAMSSQQQAIQAQADANEVVDRINSLMPITPKP